MYMYTCRVVSEMAENGTGAGPRDAAVMEAILREMGVEDFEPNVIHQMLEFTYSQSSLAYNVHVYSRHASFQSLLLF